MKKKIRELEELATNTVGDGKSPNLFFVSQEGAIITVTRSFATAYNEWKALNPRIVSALEDRLWGVICITDHDEENGNALYRRDDSRLFLKSHASYAIV